MSKQITILVVALFFVFGFSSVFAQEEETKVKKPFKDVMQERMKRHEARVEELSPELNLTEEQKAQIKQIRTKSEEETKAVWDEARNKIKEIREKANEEIKAILTPEQKAKLDEMHNRPVMPLKPEALPVKPKE